MQSLAFIASGRTIVFELYREVFTKLRLESTVSLEHLMEHSEVADSQRLHVVSDVLLE